MDVLVSFYYFFEDWFFESGSISLEEFAQEFWLQRGVPSSKMENASYFVHLVSWYKLRRDANTLIICYEDMKENLERQVRRVAKFMSTNTVSLYIWCSYLKRDTS
jgi:Sulfotransferase domain